MYIIEDNYINIEETYNQEPIHIISNTFNLLSNESEITIPLPETFFNLKIHVANYYNIELAYTIKTDENQPFAIIYYNKDDFPAINNEDMKILRLNISYYCKIGEMQGRFEHNLLDDLKLLLSRNQVRSLTINHATYGFSLTLPKGYEIGRKGENLYVLTMDSYEDHKHPIEMDLYSVTQKNQKKTYHYALSYRSYRLLKELKVSNKLSLQLQIIYETETSWFIIILTILPLLFILILFFSFIIPIFLVKGTLLNSLYISYLILYFAYCFIYHEKTNEIAEKTLNSDLYIASIILTIISVPMFIYYNIRSFM